MGDNTVQQALKMDQPEHMHRAELVNEKVVSSVSVAYNDVEPQGWDAYSTKRLLRKLDWHIIPFMSLIYL